VLTPAGVERFRLANTEFIAGLNSKDSTPERFRIHKSSEAIQEFPRLRPLLRFRNVLQVIGEDAGSAALTSLVGAPAKLVVVSTIGASTDALVEFARYRGIENQLSVYSNVTLDDTAQVSRIVEHEFGVDGLEVVLDDGSDDLAAGRRAFEALFPKVTADGSYLVERWGWDHFLLEGFIAAAGLAPADVEQKRTDSVRAVLAEKGATLEAMVPDLVAAVATRPEVVAAVTATKHWLEVRRGPAVVESFAL
jgi:hypothetical protein